MRNNYAVVCNKIKKCLLYHCLLNVCFNIANVLSLNRINVCFNIVSVLLLNGIKRAKLQHMIYIDASQT